MIINKNKHPLTNKMVSIKHKSVLLIEFFGTVPDVITISLHGINNLSKSFFIQVQFFKYSSNPHSLLQSQPHIVGFQQ